MSYAIERRLRTDNPCHDVKKLRGVRRKRLMSWRCHGEIKRSHVEAATFRFPIPSSTDSSPSMGS